VPPPRISRKCAACEEEAQPLQPKMLEPSVVPSRGEPGIVQDVLRTPGQPLDPESRAFFEPRFGNDFSQVRIHADTRAAESARAMDARAYTVGQHVAFGRDRYAPHTADGRRLLAHELTHTLQQRGGAAGLQRAPDPPGSRPPQRPALEARLQVVEETGPAVGARLDQIIRTGGPIPTNTKVIGAWIIDVEGFQGPKEIRAINGADTDALGAGAPVFHAPTPTARVLSETQGPRTERGGRAPAITGPRRESINPHINDTEIKGFEFIIPRLPKGAKGTIHFTTVRVRQVNGQTVLEPYPACSGCIRASFETAGRLPEVDLVSHAPVHPPGTVDMNAHPGGDHETPIENPRKLPPKVVQTTPKDANVEQSTGRVVPGQGTDAANAARAQRANKPTANPAAGHDTEVHEGGGGDVPAGRGAVRTSHATELATGIGMGIASVGLGWVAAKLKAKVDAQIAERQVAALLEAAKRKINANPDDALKKMMQFPDAQVYAWVHLDSAVITTYGVDNTSAEPMASDSAPLISLGPVEYATGPVPPELAQGFPQISGAGSHSIVIHAIILDLPIPFVPLETLIGYAKERGLALDDLRPYVLRRYQDAITSAQSGLDARAAIWNALKTNDATWNLIDAQYRAAEKRKDIEAQKSLLTTSMGITKRSLELQAELPQLNDIIARQDATLKHWQDMMDLVKPSGP